MNSWLKQWKSQVIIWESVKLSCFARHQCTVQLSSMKGALWLSLGQESYCSRPGPVTFHTSEIRLDCVSAFSSRRRFRQWWEVHRQDPDSSYIELYRHTTCPEATEKKKKKTSWAQKRYFKICNLSNEIVSMQDRSCLSGKWQQMHYSWKSFVSCCKKQGPQTPAFFSCKTVSEIFNRSCFGQPLVFCLNNSDEKITNLWKIQT